MAVASPFFRSLPLEQHGLKWIFPETPLAHPVREGEAAALYRPVEDTARQFGGDAAAYTRLFGAISANWEKLTDEILRPPLRIPRHPLALCGFGMRALQPAAVLSRLFKYANPRALFAGLASHGTERLDAPGSSAIGLALGAAGHAIGWPIPAGGSRKITDALVSLLQTLGGEIEIGRRVSSLRELPAARIVMLDTAARQFLRLAEGKLPRSYERRLAKFRHGPGIFKIDYALNAPIPWSAGECRKAGTVHIGGTFEEVAAARREVLMGGHPEKPFILLAQPTLFDPSRAPAGKHIAWAYCHVPQGSSFDMTARMEARIEHFAPGFRDCVIARRVATTAEIERHNANLVGGSIDGGATTLWQMVARPVLRTTPYRTPLRGVYLCSSSTPPGGGVHGMCGYNAAMAALADLRQTKRT
jgi:phytoene dehydrogenase-like protein